MKETGIILSYLWLLIATYLFDWQPMTIFLSYLLEVIVILLFYCLVRLADQYQRPNHYRKHQSVITVLIGSFPLLLFQYFMIGITVMAFDPGIDFFNREEHLMLTSGVLISFSVIVGLYLIKVIKLRDNAERAAVLQENLFFQVISLSVTNLAGVLIIYLFDIRLLLPVLIAMTILRILLEFAFIRKMKLI